MQTPFLAKENPLSGKKPSYIFNLTLIVFVTSALIAVMELIISAFQSDGLLRTHSVSSIVSLFSLALLVVFIFSTATTSSRKKTPNAFARALPFPPFAVSSHLINQIVNKAPFAIVLLDHDMNITFWNHTAERLFGWSGNEVFGRPLPIIPEDQKSIYQEMISDRFQEKERSAVELKLQKKDGTYLEISLASVPLRDNHGEETGIVLFMEDISSSKSSLELLRKSEERFALFMRHFPGIAFMQDTEGRYVYGNEAWFAQLPRKRSHLWQNRADDDEWPPRKSHNALEDEKKVLNEKKVLQTIETATLGDMEISMLVLKFPIMDRDGIPVLLGGVGINFTERKRFEEAARDYKEKLSSLAVAMSLAEETERRRIAAELHDRIGQTLALSKIKIDSIDKHGISDSVGKVLEEMSGLIEMSIQQVRSLTFQISPPLLYEVGLGSAVEWLGERIFDDYGLSVVVEHDLSPTAIPEEIRGTLFAIIRELLINVAKHADATHAEVTMQTERERIRIEVKDDGRGFEPGNISVDERKEGGFGLFNIRQKTAYLNGEFFIDSVVGVGTKVIITAPAR